MGWGEPKTLFVLLLVAVAVLGVSPLVLSRLVCVGHLLVEIGEDKIEDLAVPAGRAPLDPFLDVLVTC